MAAAAPVAPTAAPDARSGRAALASELLLSRLQRMMVVRLLLVSLLFGLAVVLRSPQPDSERPFAAVWSVILAVYMVSGLYAVVLNRFQNLRFFSYLQFSVDAFCVGMLILFTGSEPSGFTWLFVFNILGAGSLLLETGALIIASVDSLVYVACVVGSWYGVLPGVSEATSLGLEGIGLYSTVGFHIVSFYLLAMLSGGLARTPADTRLALEQAAGSLLRLQDLHGRIVQNLEAGLITLGRDGLLSSFNRGAEAITGLRAWEVVGHDLPAVGDDLAAAVVREMERARGLSPGESRAWIASRDGRKIHLRLAVSEMRGSEGEIDGYIVVIEDRTELSLIQERLQQDERLAAVGRLAAGIAHEIRNPLASISGSVQVLGTSPHVDAEDAELLDIVQRESERLGDLVSDFLILARDKEPVLRRIQLGPAIDEVARLAGRQADGEEPTIEVQVVDDPEVMADDDRVRQVLWNLVNNALQAAGAVSRVRVGQRLERWASGAGIEGGLAIDPQRDVPRGSAVQWEAWARDERLGGRALRLFVDDDGKGIEPVEATSVFDPFFTTRSGGTGLGLAIVSRIVHAHGGAVTLESRPGAGTCFSVWLPLPDDAASFGEAAGDER